MRMTDCLAVYELCSSLVVGGVVSVLDFGCVMRYLCTLGHRVCSQSLTAIPGFPRPSAVGRANAMLGLRPGRLRWGEQYNELCSTVTVTVGCRLSAGALVVEGYVKGFE